MSPTPQPPMPPDVARQMQSPEAAQNVFMQQGLPQAQKGMEATGEIKKKIQELETWAGDMDRLIMAFHPPLKPLLGPIAQAALDINKAVDELAKRSGMAKGSPEVPPQQPTNPAAGNPPPGAV